MNQEIENVNIAVEHARLTTRMSNVEQSLANLSGQLQGVANKLDTLQRPKEINFIGIMSVGIACLALLGSFGAMWTQMQIRPIEIQLEVLKSSDKRIEEKMERELTWQFYAGEERDRTRRRSNE